MWPGLCRAPWRPRASTFGSCCPHTARCGVGLGKARPSGPEIFSAARRIGDGSSIGTVEDMVVTQDDQVHMLLALQDTPELFVYIALERKQANASMARKLLRTVMKDMRISSIRPVWPSTFTRSPMRKGSVMAICSPAISDLSAG